MAELLYPNGLVSSTNMQDASAVSPPALLTNIDESPDTPDASWWSATDPAADAEALLALPTPTGTITGTQTFRVYAKRRVAGVSDGLTISLYENGALVRMLAYHEVTSNTGAIYTATWNTSEITAVANVQFHVKIEQYPDFFLDSTHASKSDANAGTSPSLPFATLAAIDGSFAPGDIIGIKVGSTFAAGLAITANGSSGSPITYRSYGTGPKPLITAPGNYGISLNSADYIVLDGLAVTAADRGGVYTDSGSTGAIVRNMEIYDCGFGCEIHGPNAKFLYNYIHNGKMIVNTVGGDDDFGAAAFAIFETSGIEIGYNTIIDCSAASFDYVSDGGACETWKTCSNIHIHHNYCEDSDGFFEAGGELGDSLTNLLLERNICLRTTKGIFSWLHNSGGNFEITIAGIEFRYNTVVHTAAPSASTVVAFGTTPGSEFYFHHNIVSYNQGYTVFYGGTPTNRHNNCYWNALWVQEDDTNTLLTGEVKANPLFVSGTDFHLQGGSPAAGMGAYG